MTMQFMVEPPQALANARQAEALETWLERHRPQLLRFQVDEPNFGNAIMVLGKGGLQLRLVSDRGDLVADVGDGDHWVDVARIDSAMTGQGRGWPEFDPFDDPAAVRQAISALIEPGGRLEDEKAALVGLGFRRSDP